MPAVLVFPKLRNRLARLRLRIGGEDSSSIHQFFHPLIKHSRHLGTKLQISLHSIDTGSREPALLCYSSCNKSGNDQDIRSTRPSQFLLHFRLQDLCICNLQNPLSPGIERKETQHVVQHLCIKPSISYQPTCPPTTCYKIKAPRTPSRSDCEAEAGMCGEV